MNQLQDIFDRMRFHPVISNASRSLFASGHYAQAIFEAYKALNNFVKEKSGRQDLDGANLMELVFAADAPILKLNDLADKSDLSEQKGFQHIFKGVMLGIRNPKAHNSIIQSDPFRALEYLAMASLLAKRVEESMLVNS